MELEMLLFIGVLGFIAFLVYLTEYVLDRRAVDKEQKASSIGMETIALTESQPNLLHAV